ncbi:MAG: Alcohol dehydrogenase GroES domain protein [Acidimicrobiales bacterium]|nr:Alcohol dehydrogenase GroES domain protein [Acidimicrobiales bacterium]
MKAIQFDMADPLFPASLVDIDEPQLPFGDWARVAVTAGGICGSDLHLFKPIAKHSMILSDVATFPFLLGHEIAGRVIQSGPDCAIPVGTRVAVNPCIACKPRHIDPPCRNCQRGWTSCCLNLDSKILTSGRSLGYTQGLGGGWSEQVVAHTTMLFPIPDAIPDRAASLHEPLSIASHGLIRAQVENGDPVLVVGAGIIGLATLAAVKGLYPGSDVTVLARHDYQAEAAARCGADYVVHGDESGRHFDELAKIVGGRVVGRKSDLMLMSGFPFVVEAVGTADAVTDALRAAAHRGSVLLLGAPGISEVDLTPVWYKELTLLGSVDHAVDAVAGAVGDIERHSIERALDILSSGLLPADVVVTHEFPIDAYRDAVAAALDKAGTKAIKVVFRPQST